MGFDQLRKTKSQAKSLGFGIFRGEKVMNCRICGEGTRLILDLGYHPPSDAFLDHLGKSETYYPLELYYCDNCGLAQIGYVVDPIELFTNNYPYTTGINQGGIDHFRDFVVWNLF